MSRKGKGKTESFEKLQSEIMHTMDSIIEFQNSLYEVFDVLIDVILEVSRQQDVISKALEIEFEGMAEASEKLKEKINNVPFAKETYM